MQIIRWIDSVPYSTRSPLLCSLQKKKQTIYFDGLNKEKRKKGERARDSSLCAQFYLSASIRFMVEM